MYASSWLLYILTENANRLLCRFSMCTVNPDPAAAAAAVWLVLFYMSAGIAVSSDHTCLHV